MSISMFMFYSYRKSVVTDVGHGDGKAGLMRNGGSALSDWVYCVCE